jgi:hypothetical protein
MAKPTKSTSSIGTGTDDVAISNPITEQHFLSFTSQLTEMFDHRFVEQDKKKITEANQRSNDNFERFLLKWDKQQETPAPSHTTSPVPLNSSGLWTNPPCHSNSCLFEGKSFKPAIQDHHTDMAGYGKDNDWRFTDMTSKWHPPRTELNKFDGSGIT